MNVKKKRSVAIISAFGFLLLAAILLTGVLLLAPKSNPRYIAHRGYSDRYVDNTAASFRAAAGMGFYGIETDVRETADKVFVCNHNETAKFADGDEKKISDSTCAELTAKPLANKKTDDEAFLCLFEEYLQICKSGNKIAIIELKENFSPEQIAQILEIVDANYDRTKISVISFLFDPLVTVRKTDPSIPVQYLSKTKNDPAFDRCLQEGISADVRQTILTKQLVKAFHEKNLTVNVWTVNKKIDLAIVRSKQVDYVTSNLLYKD